MKVLEVFGEPISSGGQETFVLNLLKSIDRKDLEIDLLTPYYCDNSFLEKEIFKTSGVIYTLKKKFNPGGFRFNIFGPLLSFLKKNHYDVVHVHSGSISVLAIVSLIAKIVGIKKIIVHSHSGASVISFTSKIVKVFTFPIIRFLPTIYCACSEVAARAKFPKGVKVVYVKNGIDLNRFLFSKEKRQEIRKCLEVKDDEVLLGHVGRLSYQKNHTFMLSVLEELQRRSVKCKLVFIGEGELKDEIEREVIQRELIDCVIFTGVLPNISDFMSAMDCFLLPSRWEGLPFVGIEAQANGLPIFVSNNVSKELAITDFVVFLPIQEENVSEWADLIVKNMFKRYSNSICALRRSGYDVKETADKVRQLYFS